MGWEAIGGGRQGALHGRYVERVAFEDRQVVHGRRVKALLGELVAQLLGGANERGCRVTGLESVYEDGIGDTASSAEKGDSGRGGGVGRRHVWILLSVGCLAWGMFLELLWVEVCCFAGTIRSRICDCVFCYCCGCLMVSSYSRASYYLYTTRCKRRCVPSHPVYQA